MVDMSSGIERLSPEERLRRVRELEAEKRRAEEEVTKQRKLLEEELARKKRELEELEKKTKQELAEVESLEEKTLAEITREREREVRELERKIREFREGNQFVPESGEDAGQPPGFGQTFDYTNKAFQQAQQSIDYLLHAEQPSELGRLEAERGLYQSVRSMAEAAAQGRAVDESYSFNKLQQEMEQLKRRGEDSHGYIARIENVLNSIVDYRAEDERRRRRA